MARLIVANFNDKFDDETGDLRENIYVDEGLIKTVKKIRYRLRTEVKCQSIRIQVNIGSNFSESSMLP